MNYGARSQDSGYPGEERQESDQKKTEGKLLGFKSQYSSALGCSYANVYFVLIHQGVHTYDLDTFSGCVLYFNKEFILKKSIMTLNNHEKTVNNA